MIANALDATSIKKVKIVVNLTVQSPSHMNGNENLTKSTIVNSFAASLDSHVPFFAAYSLSFSCLKALWAANFSLSSCVRAYLD